MSDDDESDIKKRGPGRPRKNVPKKKLDRLGIVTSPSNAEESSDPGSVHAVELIYENPIMFKKIFTLFKVYSIEYVHILFDTDRVYMYSISSSNSELILVEIFGERMNKYYLEEPFHIVLAIEKIHSIFQGIAKNFSSVIFATTRSAKHHKFWIIFNDDNEESSNYCVDLNTPENNPIEDIRSTLSRESTYPISFEMEFKALKHKVVEYGNLHVKTMEIGQTIGTNATGDTTYRVYLACGTQDGQIMNQSPFNNTARINLISTFEESQFIAPVFLSSIKPLAGTLISDKVKLTVDEEKPLIFTADLDHDTSTKTKKRIIGTEKCRIRVAVSLARDTLADQ